MVLFNIILATSVVSLISLIGVFTLYFKQKFLNKILLVLISLSIGALLGGAFLHLIPEAIELNSSVFIFILVGFFSFFIIEKFFHWRHCHDAKCEVHSFAYINLLGDAVHNFIDGIIIAAGFLVNPLIGISSTIAIALHEIPQELGDFGVLVYAGFSRGKALKWNFLTALTALAGGILGFYLLGFFNGLMPFLLAIASGGFIYIAASDFLPEIKKNTGFLKIFFNIFFIIIGIFLMYLLRFLEG